MSMKLEKLTVDELLRKDNFEGLVVGIPTGMYADRSSYRNAPMLTFILDENLPCVVRARPYSYRPKIEEDKVKKLKNKRKKSAVEILTDIDGMLIGKRTHIEFDDENEKLGIAAAYIDQAIRKQTSVNVGGIFRDQIFFVNYINIRNIGFEFPGYKFQFQGGDLGDQYLFDLLDGN